MKIHLSADYQSEIWFYPACSLDGQLATVDMVSQFVHDTAPVTLPQNLLLPQLNAAQLLRLLQSQLRVFEEQFAFFEKSQALALMHIDVNMAHMILENELLARKVKQFPFLLLDLSETFPALVNEENDEVIMALKSEFRLSLSQFGTGKIPSSAIYDNVFDIIKLDKSFIQSLVKRVSFQPFIQSIVDNFSRYSQQIIISGIDDEKMLKKMMMLDGVTLQGALFPPVRADALNTLMGSEYIFPSNRQPC